MWPPPAPPADWRPAYSRQSLLQGFDTIQEVDFNGHYHPNELVRKSSREMTVLGYGIRLEDLRIEKTPVGQSTGTFIGVVHGASQTNVLPAGRYDYTSYGATIAFIGLGSVLVALSLLSWSSLVAVVLPAWFALVAGVILIVVGIVFGAGFSRRSFVFNGRLVSELVVVISGEIYEDFRREEPMPISANASAIIASKLRGSNVYSAPEHARVVAAGRGQETMDPAWYREVAFWTSKTEDNLRLLVQRVEAARTEHS